MSRQKHRGQHANDAKLFHERWIPTLNEAVRDLSWLWSRGYAEKSALELVGNRHRLNNRQRHALRRAACSDESVAKRQQHEITAAELKGKKVAIDGYNLLITIEAALAGGIVLHCRDHAYRDIASIHGTYRRVEETIPALSMIGVSLQKMEVAQVHWLLDRPVSNSGRLKGFMTELSEKYEFDWYVELVNNPDRTLSEKEEWVLVSSDGWVLDRAQQWYNLHRQIIGTIPTANVIQMTGEDQGVPQSGTSLRSAGDRDQGTESKDQGSEK